VQVARVKAMACTPPSDKGLALSRWSCPELAEQAITDGICASISPAAIRRWLSEDALKPWQYRSWLFLTTPDFAVTAHRVLDLYDRTWDGTQPYFSVPATGIEDLNDPIREWPFNEPGYTMFPVLNLAVGGSGGGNPASGVYPAEMLVDWVRVF